MPTSSNNHKKPFALPVRYLKNLPNFQQERTQQLTTLAFTLFGSAIFIIVAITPTLSVITNLQKQISDSQQVESDLQTKIQNLNELHQSYALLNNDLSVVQSALPQTPSVPTLTGQIQHIAQNSNVSLKSLQVSQVQLSQTPPATAPNSYTLNIEAEGDDSNIFTFLNSLTSFNRIITLNAISLQQDTLTHGTTVSIRATTYFMPKSQ